MLRIIVLLLVAVLPAVAAPPKARPLTGDGLLLLPSAQRKSAASLSLFREPGIGRLAELPVEQVPRFSPALEAGDGRRTLTVIARRYGWYRVIVDGSERTGWLQARPAFRFRRWGELLPGKTVALPTGLRKDYYQLRREPSAAAAPLAAVAAGSALQIVGVAGDWIDVRSGAGSGGWLRWRDENERLLVGDAPPAAAEIR